MRSDPIQEITGTCVPTRDAYYEVDAIAFATGFDAITGTLLALDIRGRGGVPLKDVGVKDLSDVGLFPAELGPRL